jgi:hypothetical protein
MSKLLQEINLSDVKIEEQLSESGEKKYIISGTFAKANSPNRNKRIYPKETLNRAIGKLRERVKDGRVRMMLDHPGMFEGPSLSRSAALVLEVTDVLDDNYARYRAQIMDTQCGKDLKAIVDVGGKVGTSTRGYGSSKEDQEWEGFDGTYSVIQDDFELESFDFVEDPSVLETELAMQIESQKRRQNMKTFEDLRQAFPEIINAHEEETNKKISALESEVASLKTSLEEANVSVNVGKENIGKLVEGIKAILPEAFVEIPESEIIEKKDSEISTLNEKIETLSTENQKLSEQISASEEEKVKSARDNLIENLKAKNPDFFTLKAFEGCFDPCMTSEEVQKVFDEKFALMEAFKKEMDEPAPLKSKVEDKATEKPASKLNEDQKADFNFKNVQRVRSGMARWTEEEYLKKFGK